MKKLLFILMLTAVALQVSAMPAKRVPHTVKLEDGTTITVYLRGDETYHFLATENGIPVIKVSDNTYRIAPELKDSVYTTWTKRSAVRNAARFAKAKAKLNIAKNGLHKTFGYPTSYTGKKKGIVILVNFSNLSMKSTSTNEAFANQFNQVGYSKNGHIGSVHDYFLDASYGKFDLEFDVFGPVTVSNSYSYYGQNNSDGDDKYPATMCIEAAKLADANYDINWKDYDWDGDGEVDQIYYLYAGYGESAGASENTIWPHEWDFTEAKAYGDGSGPFTLGGVKLNTYAVSCELEGTSGSTIDGIGTACHEFSHCLGIPDLYDTSYSGGFGMNAWDVMDQGSYNGPSAWGEVPCGYSAYERWFAGWLDFTELSEPCYIKDMPALQDSACAYILYNEGNKNEYFILENRQNNGFFKYTYYDTKCHGMLVTHVDYDETAWVNDEVNNDAKHQRMTIIPAGKTYGSYDSSYGMYSPTNAQYESMLFPGTKSITELTNTSHTSYGGKLFNKNTDGTYCMNKPVTDIAEANGLISFTFMGGVHIDTPKANEATNAGNGSFTANWDAVDNAESYTIELSAVNAGGSEILSEDMSKLADGTSDGTSDISSSLDNYMNNAGWTGAAVYTSTKGLKIGSSKKSGNLVSPLIESPANGSLTLLLNSKTYNDDETTLQISLVDNMGLPLGTAQTITLTSDAADYTITFENVTSDCKIKIANTGTKKRFYVYGITVYDGDAPSSAKTRKVASKKTVEGLTETSYTFTDLTEDTYRYRVKAVCGDASSDWSDYITVEGVNPTGIRTIDDTNIQAEYFTINGAKISRPATPGIYLVKKGDKVQKMLIDR